MKLISILPAHGTGGGPIGPESIVGRRRMIFSVSDIMVSRMEG